LQFGLFYKHSQIFTPSLRLLASQIERLAIACRSAWPGRQTVHGLLKKLILKGAQHSVGRCVCAGKGLLKCDIA
jgi:hypothetical protein